MCRVQSSHLYVKKCRIKTTRLFTRTQKQQIFKVRKLAQNITQIRHEPCHVSLRAHISI